MPALCLTQQTHAATEQDAWRRSLAQSQRFRSGG
jgi:hypothetical protein